VIVRTSTRSKIEHATKTLALEFEDTPRAAIAAAVEAVARRLLEHARFDDYVPVLAHRYVREALRDRRPGAAIVEAA